MIGILEKTSSRKKCKHGIRMGEWIEGKLQKIVDGERIDVEILTEISINDIITIYNSPIDYFETGKVEKVRVSGNVLEFITATESYCFKKGESML